MHGSWVCLDCKPTTAVQGYLSTHVRSLASYVQHSDTTLLLKLGSKQCCGGCCAGWMIAVSRKSLHLLIELLPTSLMLMPSGGCCAGYFAAAEVVLCCLALHWFPCVLCRFVSLPAAHGWCLWLRVHAVPPPRAAFQTFFCIILDASHLMQQP